jgi:hypothetical protein
MRKIEIHGTTADGAPYRLNQFREANAELSSPGARREAFLRRAHRDAMSWAKVFPDDTIFVAEVKDGDGVRDTYKKNPGVECPYFVPKSKTEGGGTPSHAAAATVSPQISTKESDDDGRILRS